MPPTVTPAERVQRLRIRKGSHDKLVAELRNLGTKATRQRIISWEKGARITDSYREALAQLDGSSPDAFLTVGQQVAGEQTSLQREVEALRDEVAALRAGVTSLAQAFAFVLTLGQAEGELEENLNELLRLLFARVPEARPVRAPSRSSRSPRPGRAAGGAG